MKRKPVWILAAFGAALLASSLLWNYSMQAAGRQGRAAQRGITAKISDKDHFDIRDKQSKDAVSKLDSRLEKFSSKQKEKNGSFRQAMASARAKKAGSVSGLQASFSSLTTSTEVIEVKGKGRKFLTPSSRQPRDSVVKGFINDNADLFGMSPKQVANLRKTADYTNPNGKLSWLKMEQQWNGMNVFQGRVTAVFTSDGELARMVSNLAGGTDEADLRTSPNVSASAAVVSAAASVGVTLSESDLIVKESSPDGRTVVFQPAGPFSDEIKLELQYFPLDAGLATLAWSTVLWQEVEGSPAYYMLVDAEERGILWRKNIVNTQTQPATYSVYNDDSPGPLSPTTALPGSGIQGAPIQRTLFTIISELPAFDNLGWITDGINTTTGNNVDAGLDIVTPNGIDTDGRAVGSPSRVFDFSYNPSPGIPPPGDAPTLADYRMGVVTQLFFWSNRYHDRLYELGFNEASGNFQQDNFGRGGLGNDFVRAEAQDFSGTNNANFGTPPDGSLPRMQMYIFTGPTPDRDGDLDQEIVLHELTHGLSNRLHNNAAGLNTTVAGGMGEGWSDFYARALLSTADEDVNGLYASGGYATLQLGPLGTDNFYYGIRRFPYAVKTTVGANGRPHNPLTFADTDPAQIDTTDGAFPESPLNFSGNGANEVHNLGEIWCMTLLEARARIITRLGFEVGNQRALQIVTDGMKLDPISPNMLQARDSILTADCAGFGGADELDIWAGFAARGMGFSAKYNTATSVTEAFDIPNLTIGEVAISNDSCSPPDGFADPGETVTLNIPLVNPYCSTGINGVTISVNGGPSISYGDIAAGGMASQPVPFTIPQEAACGSSLPVNVVITDNVGTVSRTFNLRIGRPVNLPTGNFSAANVPIAIPDLNSLDIPIIVTDIGMVGDVNVRFRLNHTFDGDLVTTLIGPDGTSVRLATNVGDDGDNFGTGANDCTGVPTVFDDSASIAIGAGIAPFEGSFKPESPLSAFAGKPSNGVWILRIADVGPLDIGTVGCATLEVTRQRFSCCGVPGAVIQAAPPIALVNESCLPGNGALDPDETVTVNFPLVNFGVANATNLVATLLPGGGVLAPSGPQSYGVLVPDAPAVARPFTFTVAGFCGGDLTATLALQDGATSLGTVTFPIRVGATITATTAFSNTAPILIPGTGTGDFGGGPGNPYPSTINVSGLTGTISKVTVQISDFNFSTFPDDVDLLLVGPGGRKLLLMSDVGGGFITPVDVDITFDDAAPATIGSTIVSGAFKPTNMNQGGADPFPAPAPAGPYPDPQLLSVFNGADPNGTWSLYAVDDFPDFVGNINGGWSLNITTSIPVCCSTPCALSVPSNITVNSDPGVCGAVVNYPAPTFTGSCGVVTSDPPSGSFFPVGTTPVMVTGTRQDGTVTASSFTVTVKPPTFGSVTGGGTVSHNGVTANFGFNVQYKKCGDTKGELTFIEHRSHGGNVELKSTSMQSLSITGDRAVFIGKAKLNGARNYTFTVTVFDKGEPGRRDKFGLQVTAPDGTVIPSLTFDPITLRSGNIQIHSSDCDHDHDGPCRSGHDTRGH